MFENLLNDENLGDPQNKFYFGDSQEEFYLKDPAYEFYLGDSQNWENQETSSTWMAHNVRPILETREKGLSRWLTM